MRKPILAPSIMCLSQWTDVRDTLSRLVQCGVGLIHVDVMDGQFVPNLMLGTDSIRQLRQ